MEEKTLTIEDVLCMLDEIEPGKGRRGYEALITTLRQSPNAHLYQQIEQMAAEAGTDRSKVGWEREAVSQHRMLDHLLTLDPETLELELSAGVDLAVTDYQALMRLCVVRRGRSGPEEDAQLEALGLALSTLGLSTPSPEVEQALDKLDRTVGELQLAYKKEVGTQIASSRVTQHLLARGLRELRATGKVSELDDEE